MSTFVKVSFVTLKIKTQQAPLILFKISLAFLNSFLLISFNITPSFRYYFASTYLEITVI